MFNETYLKVLKFIKNNGKTDIKAITLLLNDSELAKESVEFLEKMQYIKGTTKGIRQVNNEIHIIYLAPFKVTPQGKLFLEKHQEENKEYKFNRFHTRTNTILVLLTLIVSVITLILTIKQQLQ